MLTRQAAFGGTAKMLKGALHCHTTRSDGKGDPADVMRLHAENGYDFMAITDHRRYNRETFAPETGITIIPGMEYDNTIEKGKGFRCFHTVCIGPADESNGFEHEQRFESGKATNQEEYQPYLDWLHENGQMTIYCHPEWSSTPARYFEKQQGNFAMEIWNSGCAIEDHMDMNAAYWDELLGQGIRIFGVATDDGLHVSALQRLGHGQQREQYRRDPGGTEGRRLLFLLRPCHQGLLCGGRHRSRGVQRGQLH